MVSDPQGACGRVGCPHTETQAAARLAIDPNGKTPAHLIPTELWHVGEGLTYKCPDAEDYYIFTPRWSVGASRARREGQWRVGTLNDGFLRTSIADFKDWARTGVPAWPTTREVFETIRDAAK